MGPLNNNINISNNNINSNNNISNFNINNSHKNNININNISIFMLPRGGILLQRGAGLLITRGGFITYTKQLICYFVPSYILPWGAAKHIYVCKSVPKSHEHLQKPAINYYSVYKNLF